MNKKIIIGVMGAPDSTEEQNKISYEVGFLLAKNNFAILTGGYKEGIMNETLKGAFESDENSLRIGLMPTGKYSKNFDSDYVNLAIYTGIGDARNSSNAKTVDALIFPTHLSDGTLSEAAYGLKRNIPKIFIKASQKDKDYFQGRENVFFVDSAEESMKIVKTLI